MIDLSEFTPADNSRFNEYKQQTYLIVTGNQMRLKLGHLEPNGRMERAER